MDQFTARNRKGLRTGSYTRRSDRVAAFNKLAPEPPLPESERMPPKLPLCPLLAGMKP